MLSNIISLIIFPILVLGALGHKYENDEFEIEFMSKRQTTTLKGIMTIVVFFHHFSQMVNNTQWIEHSYRVAQYSVGLFFLLAGYVTMAGHMRKKNLNLKKIWSNRCWRLYLPIVIFSIIINNFLSGLLFFFIFTDLAFVFFNSNNRRLMFITFGNVLFIILCILIGKEAYWYDDVFTYAFGAAFALYREELIRYLRGKRYYLYTIVVGITFAVSTRLAYNWILFPASTIVSSTTGAFLIILVIMKINIKSKTFEFLGKYSWEIFLLHQLCIWSVSRISMHNSVVLIVSLTAAIAFAILAQRLGRVLKSKLRYDAA